MKIKNKNIINIIILFIMFILLSFLVINNKTTNIDRCVFDFIMNFKNKFITSLMYISTNLGGILCTIIILIIVCIIFFIRKKYKSAVCFGLSVGISPLLMKLLKDIVKRPRPLWQWINQGDFSFPSGHTLTAIVLYGYLINKVLKSSIKYKWLIITILLIIMLSIPLSRIYFGVHYFTDIVGGIIIGLIIRKVTNILEYGDLK